MPKQHKPIPELTDRQLRNFWRKVDKRGPDDCWEWTAHRHCKGYGSFGLLPSGIFRAHRIAYYLATGEQPGSLMICHTCDNPGCCNPVHLFLGTNSDNMADMMAKGRSSQGSKHGQAKLTEAQVLAIRASGAARLALATKYGVTNHAIYEVLSRKTWKHI